MSVHHIQRVQLSQDWPCDSEEEEEEMAMMVREGKS